jgi:proton-translocating NADH-quinone oxidoreductase chain M
LPQARVEAPVSGSVLLAGVLLKLGGYGFIRFVFPLMPEANAYFCPLVITLSVVSLFYAALTTLRQTDFKKLIAYSSVSHMAIVTLGLFSLNEVALSGSVVLMLARGFSSSGLFMAVSVLYNRRKTRTIRYYKGLAVTMPLFSIVFLLFSLCNLALPITMNFVGEIMILLGLFQSFPLVGMLTNLSVVFSASYSLFLFNRITFGTESIYLFFLNRDLTRLEIYSFLPLIIALIFFGVNTDYLVLVQSITMKTLFF